MGQKCLANRRGLVVSIGIVVIGLLVLGNMLLRQSSARAAGLEEVILSGSMSAGIPDGSVNRWPRRVLTYHIANCPTSLDCETAHAAVRAALKTWDSVSGLSLRESGWRGDITIAWEAGDHGDAEPFDGRGTVAAHASAPFHQGRAPLDGDVHFDDDETWVAGDETRPFPLEVHLPTVALHELGHALGLKHSENEAALMWRGYEGPRTLAQEDVEAIQSLYGPPGEHEDSRLLDLVGWLLGG